MRHLQIIIVFFCFFVFSELKAQTPLGADTINQINKLFSSWNDSTPGGVLTILKGNNIVFNKAYGQSDLEHAVNNNPLTIFEAGSVSKQFTAAALLMLVKDAKVSLDDDIRKYIPELPLYPDIITINHLLHHTSGLKEWSAIAAISGWPRGTKVYTQAHVLNLIAKQKSLNFKPGTRYSYSNSNYNLLVTIIERITNQSFSQFTREHIFNRLGMSSTQWRDDFRRIIPNRAIGYGKSGKNFFINMPFENVVGNGGLLTNTSDLSKWNMHWATGKIGDVQLNDLELQKGKLFNGNEIGYAAGVFIRAANGYREISHSGSTAGYRSWLAYYPDLQLSVIYLSNDGSLDPERLGQRLSEILVGVNKPISSTANYKTIPPEYLSSKVGIYKNISGFDIVELQVKEDKLFLKGGAELKAISEDTFLFGANNGKVIFGNNQIEIQTQADNAIYKKMVAPALDQKTMNGYKGRYTSEEAEVDIIIDAKDNKLILSRSPDLKIPLELKFSNGFFTPDGGILVEFTKDKTGIVTGLSVSTTRAENIKFIKVK